MSDCFALSNQATKPYVIMKYILIIISIIQLVATEDCVVITKIFQDAAVDNCIITIDFSYYLDNNGSLIYKFAHTVISNPSLYIFVDLCLQIDGEQM